MPEDKTEIAPSRRQASLILLLGGYGTVFVNILKGVVLVPLYLHYLGTRLYGLWMGSGGILTWISALDAGIASLLVQRVARAYGQKNYQETCDYYWGGLLINFGLMVILVALGLGMSFYVPVILHAGAEEGSLLQKCIFVTAISMAFQLLNNGVAGFSQALQRPLVMTMTALGCHSLSFLVTLGMLLTGWGLWAIAIGNLVAFVPMLFINFFYSLTLFRKFKIDICIKKAVIKDYFHIFPMQFLTSMGGCFISRIEPTIIVILFNPELAAVFDITKRMADVIRLMLDRVAGSTYAGFSHLYSEGDHAKTARIFSQVTNVSFSCGLVGFCAYMAGNAAFINLWVGEKMFAGQTITVLLAISLFALVISNYLSYMITTTGDMIFPLWLLSAEAAFRVILMVYLVLWCGLPGLPLAAIITSCLVSVIFYLRFTHRLPLPLHFTPSFLKLLLGCSLVPVLTAGMGHWFLFKNWLAFLPYIGATTLGLGLLMLFFNDPLRAMVVTQGHMLLGKAAAYFGKKRLIPVS